MKLIIEINQYLDLSKKERQRLDRYIWRAIGVFADTAQESIEYHELDFKVYFEDEE